MKERSINMSLDFTRLGVRLAHTAITLGLEKLREPKKLTVEGIMPEQAEKRVEAQPVEAQSPKATTSGVSTKDTIAYQNRELVKEMLLLEAHLQQGCKIGGVACDCCSKHPITIEALAHETSGMTGRPVYTKVAEWASKVGPITTPEASASGAYDEEYPKVAVELRGIRKELMTEMIGGKE
jgi:hypothetical protein